jgi:hypothetical protein
MNKETKWILESISIQLIKWGDNAGKYNGTIVFRNEDTDQFTFQLNPTLANAYLELIKDTVLLSANQLVEKLKQSLENK